MIYEPVRPCDWPLGYPTRAEFAPILAAFPLVFADDAQGRARKAALLAMYGGMKGLDSVRKITWSER